MMGFMLNARARGARLWLDTQVTGIQVDPGSADVTSALDGAKAFSRRDADGTSALPAQEARALRVFRLRAVFISPESSSTPRRLGGGSSKDGRRGIAGRTFASSTRSHRTIRPVAQTLSDGDRHVYGFHFRREGKGILLAWNDPEETPGFKN